ncbi:zinc ion binding protein [Wolffia australiana]
MAAACGANGELEAVKVEGGARSVLSLPPGSSISLKYGPQFGSHGDLLLLEVDDGLLREIYDQKVTVRGEPDEEAVLCTTSATYAMKFVGTSNSVFLIPPGDDHKEFSENGLINCTSIETASVFKVAPGIIELIQVAPRLDKLKTLLNKRPYTLQEEDQEEGEEMDNTSAGLYTWADLVHLIQASEQELMAGLKSISAVEMNGYWRLIADESIDEVLKMLLNNCIIHDWKIDLLDEEEVVAMLVSDGFPSLLVLHCLTALGQRVEVKARHVWSLEERPVTIHLAKQVLRGGKMKVEAFMGKWKSNIPQGMKADLGVLEGEVLFETFGLETWIRPYSVSALPSTPEERFAALFRERARWTWKDLQPYIRDLSVPGVSSEALLIKYTRRTQPSAEAEPIFSSR